MDYTSFWLYYCNIVRQYQDLFITTIDSFDKNILLNGQASIIETSSCEGRKYRVGHSPFYIYFEEDKYKNVSKIILYADRDIMYIYSNDDFKDPQAITNRTFKIINFFNQFLITSLMELKNNAAPIE